MERAVKLMVKEQNNKVVAYEWYNKKTGHAIVDYDVVYHKPLESKGYEKRPLIYQTNPSNK